MRVATVIVCAGLAAGAAQAKMVSPGMDKSWGKAGVSLEQYRADGIACAREAAAADLSNSDPAKALIIASRLIENDPTPVPAGAADPLGGPAPAIDAAPATSSAASTVQMIGPQRQILKAGDILKAKLEQCLTRIGYTKFKLTGEQRHRLRGLREGSDERRVYLHSLASDAAVLSRQRVD